VDCRRIVSRRRLCKKLVPATNLGKSGDYAKLNLDSCPEINPALTIQSWPQANILPMPQDVLRIEDQAGSQAGQRVLRLNGALVMTTMFEFQSMVRSDTSNSLIIDFTNVPYVDSAGIGALVGAYVTRQHGGRSLALVGVSERIHNALKVTHVEQFFRFFDTVSAAEAA
jgi:anti-sigma B factor antagonist